MVYSNWILEVFPRIFCSCWWWWFLLVFKSPENELQYLFDFYYLLIATVWIIDGVHKLQQGKLNENKTSFSYSVFVSAIFIELSLVTIQWWEWNCWWIFIQGENFYQFSWMIAFRFSKFNKRNHIIKYSYSIEYNIV